MDPELENNTDKLEEVISKLVSDAFKLFKITDNTIQEEARPEIKRWIEKVIKENK